VRLIAPLIVACLIGTGCATKKFVQREVGAVNTKVENLSTELEQTQERVRKNEADIQTANQGIVEAKGSASSAIQKAEEAKQVAVAATGKLLYTVTLSNDKVTFPFNSSELSPEAKALLDQELGPFKAANRNVFLEIEGHTCNSGSEKVNLEIGEARARAVWNYLHDQHGFALSRMQVISYGESKPVVENTSRENRAQNRRVVIKVVE